MTEYLRYGLCALFITTGVLHFARPRFFIAIMPPYIPFHRGAVFISGAAELALGGALLFPSLDPLPGFGLMALLAAVFPANVHMAVHPDRFAKIPRWTLYLRLPIQGMLIFWAWIYTR